MAVINLVPVTQSEPVLFLEKPCLDRLGLNPDVPARIRAGSAAAEARILISAAGNYAASGLLEKLGLPPTAPLMLRKEAPGCLQLGPLIGILISRGRRRRRPPYSSQNRLLYRFLSYCRKNNGLAYVFSPGGVDRENRQITGYYLEPAGNGLLQWKTHIFPLPDVVYDRILFRSVAQRKSIREITSFLAQENGIRYFNPKFLNKWETHLILCKNPALREHLPETVQYNGPAQLARFLESYGTVYVKPINGSLGAGIIRISPCPEGYRYQFRSGKQTVSRFTSTPQELWTELAGGIISPQRTYIVQRGLNLIKYNGRVFDIRVLLQKDGRGRWMTSAMVARVASEGNIFPNVAAGGIPVNLDTLWRELTLRDWSTGPLRDRVEQISIKAAETLEKSLGTFAEIGLDIGIDTDGQVWIIEANSKPSYKVFPQDQLHLKREAIKHPVDFAVYLAGFAREAGQEPDGQVQQVEVRALEQGQELYSN